MRTGRRDQPEPAQHRPAEPRDLARPARARPAPDRWPASSSASSSPAAVSSSPGRRAHERPGPGHRRQRLRRSRGRRAARGRRDRGARRGAPPTRRSRRRERRGEAPTSTASPTGAARSRASMPSSIARRASTAARRRRRSARRISSRQPRRPRAALAGKRPPPPACARFVFLSSIGVHGAETFGRAFRRRRRAGAAFALRDLEARGRDRARPHRRRDAASRSSCCGRPSSTVPARRATSRPCCAPSIAACRCRSARSTTGAASWRIDNLVDLIAPGRSPPRRQPGQAFLVSDGEDLSTTELLRRTGARAGSAGATGPGAGERRCAGCSRSLGRARARPAAVRIAAGRHRPRATRLRLASSGRRRRSARADGATLPGRAGRAPAANG